MSRSGSYGPYRAKRLTAAQYADLVLLKRVDENYQALRDERNRLMVRLRSTGVTNRRIAEAIGVSESTITRRLNLFTRRGHWRDLRRKPK